jgi:hypothetical protein
MRTAPTMAAPTSIPRVDPSPGLDLPDLDMPGAPSRGHRAPAAPTPLELPPAPAPEPRSVASAPLVGRAAAGSSEPLIELAALGPPSTGSPAEQPLASFSSAPPSRGAAASGRGPMTGPPLSGSGFDLAASPRSRPATSLRVAEQLRDASEQLAELNDLRERLRLPLTMIGIALAITIADVAMARFGGGPISVGPARAWWLAGPLATVGVALAFFRVFMGRDDG